MKFFAVAAALVAAVAAQYPVAESECSIVTVTETVTAGHVPSAPASLPPSGPAPYPTTGAPEPPVYPTGTGAEVPPVYPTGTVPGTAAPSGTGSYSAPPSEFTGAASGLKVGGFVAGAGAFAALFL